MEKVQALSHLRNANEYTVQLAELDATLIQ